MKEVFDSLFEVDTLDISDDIDAEISEELECNEVELNISDEYFCTQTDARVDISQNYNDLSNKPSINGVTLIGDFKIDVIECGTSTTVI